LQDLLLYLSIMAVGAIVGAKKLSPEKEYKWIGKIQFVAIVVLVLVMSIRIGADDRVINSLGDIGVSSFVITVLAMGGSVLGVYVLRRWLGLNRKGLPKDD
jgi:uncharacterized membrane protein YadS